MTLSCAFLVFYYTTIFLVEVTTKATQSSPLITSTTDNKKADASTGLVTITETTISDKLTEKGNKNTGETTNDDKEDMNASSKGRIIMEESALKVICFRAVIIHLIFYI